MNLFTFGYEGLSVDVFIRRLKAAGVRRVVDVRQLPLSRKPGFSKNALAAELAKAKIVYEHVAALGCPRPIRDRYKETADWAVYTKAYGAYLATQKDVVAGLARVAKRETVCLVCFEADFTRCHRSLVARACVRAGGPPTLHLTATEAIADVAVRSAA